MIVPASGFVEYTLVCSFCGDSHKWGWAVRGGEQYPRPSIPPGWITLPSTGGPRVLVCGKHKVETRVDGEIIA